MMTDPWLPIETAPKDGTQILVFRRHEEGYERSRIGVDHWEGGTWWRSRRDMMPTHWMPLPAAPGGSMGCTEVVKPQEYR